MVRSNNFISNNKNISNLEYPGKYVLNVTQDECEEFLVTVTEPTELQANVIDLKILIVTVIGRFRILIEGGTPPYYVNDQIFGVPGINSYTVNYLNQYPGVKNYEIKDSNECKIITLNPEILGPSSTLVIEEEVINSCDVDEK